MDDCRDCRSIAARMTPYVDGSLPPDERAAVERHLRECPPCRDEANEESAGRTVLRDCAARLRQQPVPQELRSRCEALARARMAASSPRWRANLIPVTLATILIVFTGAAIMSLATQRSNTVLAAQLTADHLKCFRSVPADAAGLNAAVVEQMLDRQYGWDIHVPPAGAEGLQLVEGRRCLMIYGGVPHLLYRAHGQDVSLFILDGETRNADDLTTLGHRARIWSRGGKTFVMVSSPSADEAIARYVEKEAH